MAEVPITWLLQEVWPHRTLVVHAGIPQCLTPSKCFTTDNHAGRRVRALFASS